MDLQRKMDDNLKLFDHIDGIHRLQHAHEYHATAQSHHHKLFLHFK
jgi:hypothetical protein